MRRLSRRSFIGLVLFGVAFAPGATTYSGLCISQMRYVPNEEKIRNVVSKVVSDMNAGKDRRVHIAVRTDHGYVEYPGSTIVPYEDADDFFKINKDCCSVGLDYGIEHIPRTFVRQLTGGVSDFVVIRFQRRFVDAEGILHSEQVDAEVAVDVCGVPVFSDDGWII